jgi:hypothetical protein
MHCWVFADSSRPWSLNTTSAGGAASRDKEWLTVEPGRRNLTNFPVTSLKYWRVQSHGCPFCSLYCREENSLFLLIYLSHILLSSAVSTAVCPLQVSFYLSFVFACCVVDK